MTTAMMVMTPITKIPMVDDPDNDGDKEGFVGTELCLCRSKKNYAFERSRLDSVTYSLREQP